MTILNDIEMQMEDLDIENLENEELVFDEGMEDDCNREHDSNLQPKEGNLNSSKSHGLDTDELDGLKLEERKRQRVEAHLSEVQTRVGRSGGLVVLWKQASQCQVDSYSSHHIDMLFILADISNIPWCIWGDFNDLMAASDKKGGKFTWERGRNTSEWVREKLDRGFGTGVMERISISIREYMVKRTKFRAGGICNLEINPCKTFPSENIEVTSFMARWGRLFFHKFKEKIKHHKANLDKLVNYTGADSIKEYLSEREKLNTLLFQEEMYWRQRAKVFWLKDGDDNTRFFHTSAFAKKKANKIEF
ncbi:uncharacterized protein LOC141718624 [Apium graveolens]|uniref:uncharacterized protein LOC141718624 n=1 Tax=Apium graveolens TaxID=4045 RepID=UPI003D7B4B98